MKSNITQVIIGAAKANKSLLNWDGETSKTDMLENIRSHIHSFCGWKSIRVDFTDGILTIEVEKERHDTVTDLVLDVPTAYKCVDRETLLKYHIKHGREIIGRLRHCGITYERLMELSTLPDMA